ncbi:MAG: DUF6473 family protein [Gemmobacter sp.]
MACIEPGAGALDYFPCTYGASRLVFRGPGQRIARRYCVALGGAETFGRFVAEPWPQLLQRASGRQVLNLGCVNVGIDAYLNAPEILAIARRADLRLVQVVGAANLSNRFYTVHGRRNDRFVSETDALRRLFPEIDFTEFNFTRHLVRSLERHDPDRFAEVARHLRQTWVERMQALLDAIGGPAVLLRIGRLGAPADEPMLVDPGMIAELAPRVAQVVEMRLPARAAPPTDMRYGPFEAAAAAAMPGPAEHRQVAEALLPLFETV